jgi:hypothetical protein
MADFYIWIWSGPSRAFQGRIPGPCFSAVLILTGEADVINLYAYLMTKSSRVKA